MNIVNQSCLDKIQNAANSALTELVMRVGVTVVDYYRDDTSQKYIFKLVRMNLIKSVSMREPGRG